MIFMALLPSCGDLERQTSTAKPRVAPLKLPEARQFAADMHSLDKEAWLRMAAQWSRLAQDVERRRG
jgi:hypothetical protein